MKLICLPHAGGMSTYYDFLRQARIHDVDSIELIDYPGRGICSNDLPCSNFIEYVERLGEQLVEEGLKDREFVLFGHSMGAFIAYELACALERRYGLRSYHVFVSGQKPPCRADPKHYRQCEIDGIEFLYRLGGMPNLILENPAITRYFMDFCIQDLRLLQTYTPHEAYTDRRPVFGTVVCGEDDYEVDASELPDWDDYFEETPAVCIMPGGHFYLHDHQGQLVELMNKRISEQSKQLDVAGFDRKAGFYERGNQECEA